MIRKEESMLKTMLVAGCLVIAASAAQAQGRNSYNNMYSSGPGGTPPMMYNTPYAPQNQQWGNTQPQQNYMPQWTLPCVAMRGVSADPRCR